MKKMSWPFFMEIEVRFRDLDAMGHVNNAVYFTYIEIARTESYTHLVNIQKLSDIDFILASASCSFKSAISMGETVIVYVKPVNISGSRWTFMYELREKISGRLIAKAETVQVAFDYKKHEKKIIDDMLKQKLLSEIEKSS